MRRVQAVSHDKPGTTLEMGCTGLWEQREGQGPSSNKEHC